MIKTANWDDRLFRPSKNVYIKIKLYKVVPVQVCTYEKQEPRSEETEEDLTNSSVTAIGFNAHTEDPTLHQRLVSLC